MEENVDVEKELLDPMLVDRMNRMLAEHVISNAQLSLILSSLEKKGSRRQKKEKKKNAGKEKDGSEYLLPDVTGISYAQSEQVWGSWAENEKSLPRSGTAGDSSVFLSPAYNFRKAYLRGFSVADMAKRFPNHNWGKYEDDKRDSIPACYLISLDNPLINLAPADEFEQQPKSCSRLDLNLTVELLLTLSRLGAAIPPLFYRTSVINGHKDEVCVGIIDGKISFLSEDKVRAQKKMAICIAKDEPWM